MYRSVHFVTKVVYALAGWWRGKTVCNEPVSRLRLIPAPAPTAAAGRGGVTEAAAPPRRHSAARPAAVQLWLRHGAVLSPVSTPEQSGHIATVSPAAGSQA